MNQGLNLTYGFNHAEAGRAFAEAARLDPTLAMAYWGQALVLGPNINAPMDAAAEPKALALANQAVALKANATPRERAYIDALTARYTGRPEDRATAHRDVLQALDRRARQDPHQRAEQHVLRPPVQHRNSGLLTSTLTSLETLFPPSQRALALRAGRPPDR